MKQKILLVLSLIFVAANVCAAQTARKNVTNADLEKYRQARLKSEADYRANYQKLGMPSPEELERREAERQVWLAEFARRKAVENEQSQNDFQARANQLRAEIVGVQAQINYLRGEIGGLPNQNSIFLNPSQLSGVVFGSYGYGVPYGYGRQQRRGGFNQRAQTNGRVVAQAPNVQTAINAAAAAPNPYAGTVLEQTGVKLVIGANNRIGRRGRFNRPYYGGYGVYGVPYAAGNNTNEREDLVSRLRYLEQTKAGLLAQFELLRDEARRAGVKID